MTRPVRCVQTGTVYPSIRAAFQAHGVSLCGSYYRDALEGYPVTRRGLLFDPIDPGDPDWPQANESRKRRLTSPAARPVVCVETGEAFVSGFAAARAVGVSRNAIYQSIRRGYRAGGVRWSRSQEVTP